MIVILSEPELRHVLAHLVLAIEHAAEGRSRAARMELESVQGLIFYPRSDRATEKLLGRLEKRMGHGKKKGGKGKGHKGKGKCTGR